MAEYAEESGVSKSAVPKPKAGPTAYARRRETDIAVGGTQTVGRL